MFKRMLDHAEFDISELSLANYAALKARGDGYALADQEVEIGFRSIAVPLRRLDGRIIAALNIGVHSERMPLKAMHSHFFPSLHALALENLGRTFGPEPVRKTLSENSITMIKCLDSYDAARLLLLPGYLQPGEALAALVPDRDTLTILPLPGGGNWAPLAELAKSAASDHLLLDRPLRVTCDGFGVM